MIPLVAIVTALITGESGTNQISIGANIGAPFLLATLGMGLVGASALGFRRRRENGEPETNPPPAPSGCRELLLEQLTKPG